MDKALVAAIIFYAIYQILKNFTDFLLKRKIIRAGHFDKAGILDQQVGSEPAEIKEVNKYPSLKWGLVAFFGGMGFKMSSTTLKEYTNLCEGERFGDEPSIATCTGFLIGEDLLATAGHCMTGPATCASSAWVFDYRTDAIGSFRDPHVLATSVFY